MHIFTDGNLSIGYHKIRYMSEIVGADHGAEGSFHLVFWPLADKRPMRPPVLW